MLDLGSGAGPDLVLSARRVGPDGLVYGLDFLEEMLAVARRNIEDAEVDNVVLLKGTIEQIPLPAATVDVVISNCVINLSLDKPAVFAELARVLAPGGRVGISDVVAEDRLSPADRAERGSRSQCVAGALSRAEYLAMLADAGLANATVTFTEEAADGMHSAIIRARKPTEEESSMKVDQVAADQVLASAEKLKLINSTERGEIMSVLRDDFPYAEAVSFTDSVHAHIKVDDVDDLPHEELKALGYRAENPEFGYIKYATDSGINLIFSSIPIAVDDNIPGAVTLQKPFMDHVGIDMRDEAPATKAAFDAIPARAAELGWREAEQSGMVHCCHTQVKAKHWTYPPEGWQGWRRPIEFAFGELVIFDKKMGCDLRPIDPGHALAGSNGSCCGG